MALRRSPRNLEGEELVGGGGYRCGKVVEYGRRGSGAARHAKAAPECTGHSERQWPRIGQSSVEGWPQTKDAARARAHHCADPVDPVDPVLLFPWFLLLIARGAWPGDGKAAPFPAATWMLDQERARGVSRMQLNQSISASTRHDPTDKAEQSDQILDPNP